MTSDLLSRMRSTLAHAQAHRMLAASVDVADLSLLIALAATRRWKARASDFTPAERALCDCEARLLEARSELSNQRRLSMAERVNEATA